MTTFLDVLAKVFFGIAIFGMSCAFWFLWGEQAEKDSQSIPYIIEHVDQQQRR